MPNARIRDAIPQQGQTRHLVWFFDNYLSRHCDQGNFQDDAYVNGVFLHVCLQGFDQLYADEDQEEVAEDVQVSPGLGSGTVAAS